MNNPLVQPDPGLYIWTILTFLVLVWGASKVFWRPLMTMLDEREETIASSIERAKQARLETERLHKEQQTILAEALSQAEEILTNTRADAARNREELRQKAQADAQTIVRNAEKQIAQETARALQQIRAEAVDISVAIASKLLQRNVSRADNERLIEETFAQIDTQRPS